MLLLALLSLACTPPAPPAAPIDDVRAIPPHGALAGNARDALVHGDLVGTREDAAGLAAGLRKAELADGERPARDATVAAAEGVAAAPDLASAALGLGHLVTSCSGCHQGRAPAEPVPPTPGGDGVRAEMQRHDRAMLGIWAGLLAGDRERVASHGEALALTVIAPIEGATPAVTALDDAVSAAARSLAAAATQEEQATRFGALVLACAACHGSRPDGIRIEPE